MLPPFEAILFDFDGTLAVPNLDFADMRQQLVVLTQTWGLPAEELHGRYILELMDHAAAWLRLRDAGQSASYYQQAQQLIQDIEIEAARRSGLLPGIQELLISLQERRITVGIVTRNCDVAVRTMFSQVDTYCQAFFARDHVTHVKPHPSHLQAALARLCSAPARTLMVGDGTMDMQAGKHLQMFSIGVLSGSNTREELIQHGADLVLDTAVDLMHYLPDRKGHRV